VELTDIKQETRVYEVYKEQKIPSKIGRFFDTIGHLLALGLGIGYAFLRKRKESKAKKKIKFTFLKIFLFFSRIIVDDSMIHLPVGVQLRKRMEILGPTYIKLGQILSLREDILPKDITDELKKMLDTLPAISYERFEELVEIELGKPYKEVFHKIDKTPLGSASIAQVHRATLNNGDDVVIKLLKPGTRELITIDSEVIKKIASILDPLAPQLQIKNMLTEFCDYTAREVDLKLEANNAEEFAVNFSKIESVVFPKVYRSYSTSDMLIMEFIDGKKPDENLALVLNEEEKEHIVDIGAFAIMKMLYEDGFFHADLHPGNLLIVDKNKCTFIDLGMVGRFEDDTRKILLYQFNSLILGDVDGAARYMALLAVPGKKGDVEGFKKAYKRIAKAWIRNPNFNSYSMGRLIYESTRLGAEFHMYFPIETILMVKAIVTFEGVGNVIQPGVDIAKLSRKHMRRLLIKGINPLELLRNTMQNAPEFIDMLSKSPHLMVEITRRAEVELNKKKTDTTLAIRRTILAGFFFLGGCIFLVGKMHPLSYVMFFALSLISFLGSRNT
jgi:ubiquinone biosynthesis protein